MGKIRERRADSTADTYASCLRNQVLPQLGELRLDECGGTPTGAEPSSTRCPASPRAVPKPLPASTAAGLLEASPAHQLSGQAGHRECGR